MQVADFLPDFFRALLIAAYSVLAVLDLYRSVRAQRLQAALDAQHGMSVYGPGQLTSNEQDRYGDASSLLGSRIQSMSTTGSGSTLNLEFLDSFRLPSTGLLATYAYQERCTSNKCTSMKCTSNKCTCNKCTSMKGEHMDAASLT